MASLRPLSLVTIKALAVKLSLWLIMGEDHFVMATEIILWIMMELYLLGYKNQCGHRKEPNQRSQY